MENDYDETENLVQSDVNQYIFSLNVTDKLQQIFLLFILVGNILSVNFAIIFMCLSWYVKSSLEKQVAFLKDFYNLQAIPAMLGLSGFIILITSIIGVKAAIAGRMLDDEGDLQSASHFFHIYFIAALVASWAALITALTCFIEISVLHSALGKGLLFGMKNYMLDRETKSELDILQMNYRCCGSESYKDWYKISWVDAKYLQKSDALISKSLKDGKYLGKDVPFSCCKWSVMRPCVDTRIEDNSYHSKYNFPDDLTINTEGCKIAVSGFLGHTIFRSIGIFVFFCCLFWVAMAILGRYLNTSMNAMSIGDPPIGWLIPYVNPRKSSSPKTDIQEWEE